MNLATELIAKKMLDENEKVVLFCAGNKGIAILKELKKYWDAKPVCICDNDPLKRYNKIMGVDVLPIDDVLSEFPDAYFYIASEIYKYQIIGFLISDKYVSPDKILNYEQVEKRISCTHLETDVVCLDHRLEFCCSDFGKKRSPFIDFNGDYDMDAKKFIAYRDELINNLNNGTPTPCDGCPCLKYDWYPVKRKISLINYGEAGICNFDCCYCRSNAKTSKSVRKDLNLVKLYEALNKHSYLSKDLQFIISSGEITVHPQRKAIYNLIQGYESVICTNASIFDQDIRQLLELGNSKLVVSMDAGTESTFFKIKGRDIFNKVCENLKLYSNAGDVNLKYIILPGINDNKADIDGFIDICKDIDAGYVQISHDIHSEFGLTDATKKMIVYFINQLSINGFSFNIISNIINDALKEGMKSNE